MEIKKRGMEPDGGGEIFFSCEPVKYTKAVQVRLILLLLFIFLKYVFYPMFYNWYTAN